MIGRQEEIKRLNEIMEAKRSTFVAVTGRRRVGKTYFVDTLLKAYFCFSLTGIQHQDMRTQLINFGIKLAEYNGKGNPVAPENWQEAFQQLKEYLQTLPKDRKQVIFIDELPWVATARSGFVQMLAHFWNDYLSKESHFILVICGSATSWITRNIIDDPGGLHNRVMETIHLLPFTIAESKAFLKSKGIQLTSQEVARIYMALGGVPFYLDKVRKGESSSAAIERICFAPRGPLRNEYPNLYRALFNNANIHESIVATLALHPQGMNHAEILQESGLTKSGSYHRAVQDLLLSGFIIETPPMGKMKRGSLYRLIDEYSIFYHRFIQPLGNYSPGIWQQFAAGQAYKSWTGYAFEALCHKHIGAIKKALGIGAVYTEISSIQVQSSPAGEGFQIDLLIDRKDDCINLCEIKFHAGPFALKKDEYQKLLNKRQRFIEHTNTRKQVFITLITNYELMKNEYSLEMVDAAVTLEDIIKYADE